MSNKARCEHCLHAVEAQDGENYECRRFPPDTHLVPTQHPMTQQQGLALQSLFPVLRPDQWCGEFADAPQIQEH